MRISATAPQLESVSIADHQPATRSFHSPVDAAEALVGDVLEIDDHIAPFAESIATSKANEPVARQVWEKKSGVLRPKQSRLHVRQRLARRKQDVVRGPERPIQARCV